MLLRVAVSDGEAGLVAGRVRGVRALVVLHVARAAERVREVLERRVALDLELGPARGHCRRGDTAERAGELLEVARGGSGGGGGSLRGCGRRGGRGGVAVVVTAGAGVALAGARDDVALVVDGGDVCELGRDAKDGVESVSLLASLNGGRGRSSASCLTSGLSCLVGGA